MIVLSILVGVSIALNCLLWWEYIRMRRAKDSEHYTDFVHGNLTMRVYKPMFEYPARTEAKGTIIEGGTLSPTYDWLLIQKK